MSSGGEEDYTPWIQQFCDLFGHDYFVPVAHEFIEDDFNLTGLSSQVPYYREALYVIMDYQVDTAEDNASNNGGIMGMYRGVKNDLPSKALLAHSAELLYGLIHARYIISRPGISAMVGKFERNEFGFCPRYLCDGMHLIPVGATDVPGRETVRLYCPCCNDIYLPSSSRYLNIDGAFFGTTFPGLFLKMFPEIQNQCANRIAKISRKDLGIHLFGFRINELSLSGPRMKWLRMHPQTPEEIEEYNQCEFHIPPEYRHSDEEDGHSSGDDDDDDDNTMVSEDN